MGKKLGRNAYVLFGAETTEGTAVAGTRTARLVSLTVTPTVTSVDIPDLSLSADGFPVANHKETERYTWEMGFFAYYEGGSTALLLRSIIGGTWVDTGSGPYTHVLVPGAQPPSMTYRTDRDYDYDSSGLSRGDVLAGCRTASATFDFRLNGMCLITVRGVAMSWTPGASPGLTPPVHDDPILSHEADNWTWNSVDYTPRSIQLEVDNGLLELDGFGSAGISGSIVNDARGIRMTVSRYKDSDNWTDAQAARTESTGDITFTSGTDSFKIDLGASMIRDAVAHASGGVQVIEESAVFVPRYDGTNPVIKFTLVNDDALAEDS